jgi:hypothetical protein
MMMMMMMMMKNTNILPETCYSVAIYKSVVSSYELYYRLAEINVSETYHSACAEVPAFAEDVRYIDCIFGEIVISNYPSRATLVVQGNCYLLQP